MLAQPVAGIKRVSQPYRSHGGSAPETTADFQMRVSERLRHKQRASLPRDYEQLVLAVHPDVWQVRCVGPNQFRRRHDVPGLRSGEVMLVVVPRFDARPEQAAPFSGPALDAIAAGVATRCATAVRAISVRNVSYELLKVTVQLRLKPDMDGQQCVREINAAIVAFLSPWLRQARPMLDLGAGEV
ncbi:MAG: baseplate J/gp47 family protein, partial [Pseudomonadota bacterium]